MSIHVYIFNLTWAKHVVWVIFITWHPSSMSSSHFNLLFISQTARPNISQIWLECLLHGPLWKLYNFDWFRNPKWLPMHQHRPPPPPFQNVPKRMFYVLSSPDLKGHMSFSYDLVFVVLNFKKKNLYLWNHWVNLIQSCMFHPPYGNCFQKYVSWSCQSSNMVAVTIYRT